MRNSKSSLFLMEMIIAILVFSVSAAVCIQIFVKAYLTSEETQTLNSSVTLCTSAAELFYGYRGDMSKIQHELDPRRMSRAESDCLTFFYDGDFNLTYEGSAVYRMTMKNVRSDDILTTNIAMVRVEGNQSVYYLDCKLFLRETGAAGNTEDVLPEGAVLDSALPAGAVMDNALPGAGVSDNGISTQGAVSGGVL